MHGEFIAVGSETWREIWQPPIDPDSASPAWSAPSCNSPDHRFTL
jgi:hypothetical protein